MKEILYVDKIPTAYKGSNYYQRKADFIGELKGFVEHAKKTRKNIFLLDFTAYFETKYGFSVKAIREELNKLEKQMILVINNKTNIIEVFSEDIDETTKTEAETEADNILKGV